MSKLIQLAGLAVAQLCLLAAVFVAPPVLLEYMAGLDAFHDQRTPVVLWATSVLLAGLAVAAILITADAERFASSIRRLWVSALNELWYMNNNKVSTYSQTRHVNG